MVHSTMNRLLLAAVVLAVANGINSSIIEPRIIGGKETKVDHYPFMVSLRVMSVHSCGGAILTRKHFISAARCLPESKVVSGYFTAVLGATALRFSGKSKNIKTTVRHPYYQLFKSYWDVAIGTLYQPIDFVTDGNAPMMPISLVDVNQTWDKEQFKILGWGPKTALRPGEVKHNEDDTLHVAVVQTVSYDKCRVFERTDLVKEEYIWKTPNETLICAGGGNIDHSGTFTVDKAFVGAPLVNRYNKLVGIATYPQEGPNVNWPALYANLSDPQIHKFITDNIV